MSESNYRPAEIKYHPWVQRYIDSVDGRAHQSAVKIITELSSVIDDIWNVLSISPNSSYTDIHRLVMIGDILDCVITKDNGQPFYQQTTPAKGVSEVMARGVCEWKLMADGFWSAGCDTNNHLDDIPEGGRCDLCGKAIYQQTTNNITK